MRILLSLVVVCALIGCKRPGEPIGRRPAEDELMGNWILANSPTMSPNPPVKVPTAGSSTLRLASNRVARLTNVLVEEIALGRASGYRTTLKSEDAVWDVGQSMGLWSVQILLTNHQYIVFPVRETERGELILSYYPDPEKGAFIYVQPPAKEKR